MNAPVPNSMKLVRSIGGIALVLIGLLQPAHSNDVGAPTPNKYQSMPSGTGIALDLGRARIVLDGHSVLRAEVCPSNSPYVCMYGEGGIFVFPKRKIATGESWSFQGHHFRASRELQVRMLGKTINTHLIEQQGVAEPHWYVYSAEQGLVAFGRLGGTSSTPTAFVNEGACGFGAPATCPRKK